MIKYMIHACPQRMWYVEKFLIPSMLNQGISANNIIVHNDSTGLGNLESCMRGFLLSEDYAPDRGIWHLQDDIVICSDFKERTEEYNEGVVCGYCFNNEDRKDFKGFVGVNKMWFSFPCIRIPTHIAVDCAKWYYKYAQIDYEYRMMIAAKKYDDSMFEIYMSTYQKDIKVLNLAPNLVDHVDYLIGGSVATSYRTDKTPAMYFEDKKAIEDLKKALTNIV